MELHTVEDVFVTLAHITGLGQERDALRVLHSATLNADLDGALAIWRHVHKVAMPRTWRVISQKSGSHDFRRMDAGEAVGDALRRTLPRSIHHVADDADLEFWLWLSGGEALIGLRLSDATMRHRTYKENIYRHRCGRRSRLRWAGLRTRQRKILCWTRSAARAQC